jgi:hypothetical protein
MDLEMRDQNREKDKIDEPKLYLSLIIMQLKLLTIYCTRAQSK